MAKFLSGRQKNIKIGISSYSENLTSLEVIGKVGIGSTAFNPVADLDIRGSLNVRDTLTVDIFNLVYDNLVIGGNLSVAGIGTINTLRSSTGIVTSLSGTNLNYSGISTIETLRSNSGIVTSLSGTNLNYSGIGTITTLRSNSGIVTSLSGTNLNYSGIGTIETLRSNSGIVTSLSGTNLNYSGIGTIETLRSNSGIVTNISGTNLNYSGISTLGLTSTTNLTSQQLFVSGLSTFSGITTHTTSLFGTQASFTGVVTASSFRGDGSQLTGVTGTQVVSQPFTSTPVFPILASNSGVSSVGIATTGPNALVFIPSSGNLGIGTTNPTSKLMVVGDGYFTGIITASSFVGTALSISGISTLGGLYGVVIKSDGSNGIVTSANPGVSTVTYYGDGSKLTGIATATSATNVVLTTDTSSTTTNIVFSQTPNQNPTSSLKTNPGLIFDASTSSLGIGTTNPTSKLTVQGDALVSGIITATSFRGDGSQLTGVTGTQVVSQPFTSTPVFPILASNSGVSSVGIATTGPNALVFIPSSGNLGIGTTNPTSKLQVAGDVLVSGVVTASNFVGTLTGNVSSATFATNAGIATFATTAGIATFATNAGIATNLKGGLVGNVPYQSATDTTVFLTNGSSGTILQSNGVGNAPSWVSPAPAAAITGLTIRDEGTIVGGANSVSQLNFVGAIVSVASTAGIATITFLDYVSNAGIATFATNAGISTFATNAGIATFATNAGIATFATNAGIATALQYSRTFEITGDIVASPISFDGTSNVSLAATIQPNSVGLGTDTFGDYVKDISGTANQITVTGGTGEGSTPTLSIPNQFTAPQDVTVTRDLLVSRNLNVNGNITIGGTASTLFASDLFVFDRNIVLGIGTTNISNADITTDNTANGGGIAIASTEGNPLVSFDSIGVNTYSVNYKQIAWFKTGTFAGLGTDAWLINYAVGIGSTQFPSGTRLAAGSVQFTENDLAIVRNINASGIGTIPILDTTTGTIDFLSGTNVSYSGIGTISTLDTTTGTIDFLSNTNLNTSGIGTISTLDTTTGTIDFLTNTNLNTSGIGTIETLDTTTGTIDFLSNTNLNTSGIGTISTLDTTTGTIDFLSNTNLNTSGIGTISTLDTTTGTIDFLSGTNVSYSGIGTINTLDTTTGTIDFLTNTNLNTSGIGTIETLDTTTGTIDFLSNTNLNTSGIGTISTLDTTTGTIDFLSNTNLNTSGIGTISTLDTTTGTIDFLSGTNVSYSGIGTINTLDTTTGTIDFLSGTNVSYSGIGTIETLDTTTGTIDFLSGTNVSYSGIATLGITTINQLYVSGVSTFTNGPVLIGSATSTGTVAQPLQVSGGAYVSGNLGIGTTNPTSKLTVVGDVLVVGVVTATDFNSASDAKLKTNIQPIADPLEKVIQIKGVSFNWIKDNKPSMGVIANELQKVLPELVSDTDPKTVNYNGLIGLLIECVKHQQNEIEQLKKKVN
jgi:hypothetical protein